MFDITSYLTQEHRECDEIFAQVEELVNQERWEEALQTFKSFKEETLKHLQKEEDVLFPEFEGRAGITMGPTKVMRMEYAQARDLMERMEKALLGKDKKTFLSTGETFIILILQYNMKEEQILYPICDQHLDTPEIIEKKGKNMKFQGLSI